MRNHSGREFEFQVKLVRELEFEIELTRVRVPSRIFVSNRL